MKTIFNIDLAENAGKVLKVSNDGKLVEGTTIQSGGITDVKVDGSSVVNNGVAEIEFPVAAEIETDEVGVSVQDRLDELHRDLNYTFANNISFPVVNQTTQCNLDTFNPSTKVASTIIREMPIASPTVTGLVPKETMTAVTNLITRVTALEGGAMSYAVTIPDLSEEDDATVQSILMDLYRTASGNASDPVPEGVLLADPLTGMTFKWFTTSDAWIMVTTPPIGLATQTRAGIVQGTPDPAEDPLDPNAVYGKIYVEDDGTMSLLGWDMTRSDIDNINITLGQIGPGIPGTSPNIGADGNWWVGSTNTGVKAQGNPGANGAPGISPHIDTNTGNWFIGETNTGIKAQGIDGPAGAPNVLTIGTVTSVINGEGSNASISGLSPTQQLNLILEAGPEGPPGNAYRGIFATPDDLTAIPIEGLEIGHNADVLLTNSKWIWNISYLGDIHDYTFPDDAAVFDWYPIPSVLDFYYNSTTETIWQFTLNEGADEHSYNREDYSFKDMEVGFPPFESVTFNDAETPIWEGDWNDPFNPEREQWINSLFPVSMQGPQGEQGDPGVVQIYEAVDANAALIYSQANPDVFVFVAKS